MSTNKQINKICCGILIFTLILTVLFVNAGSLGVEAVSRTMGYEQKLFDTSIVHTIDIEMDDWDDFISTCEDEEYTACSVIIDNEAYKNVGIRAKGNTSLSQVSSYGNDRYSFKIEFDKYDSSKSYYGLDKLSLNNIIQDNTYMKDYLTYQMMGQFGVASPLCSYVSITVNGEPWGLYLAVEGVEEAFLARNYGSDYGELYKPDSMDLGGGRGNGRDFNMDEMQKGDVPGSFAPQTPDEQGNAPEDTMPQVPDGQGDADNRFRENRGFGQGTMGSNDVSLIYSDDSYESYQNIFDNAKTDITDSDKDRLIASLKDLNNQENLEEVVDIESVIRYFVVHNFVCNFDSYTGSLIHNYYLYEQDGQLSMIPWDYNLAFGGFQSQADATSLVNYPIDTPVSGGTVDLRPMLSWILQNEEYLKLYHTCFAEFLSQFFENGTLTTEIDRVSELIAPYVEEDPTKFCTYEEFETGVSTLKEFCTLRAQSIAGQLDGTIPATSDEQNANTASLIDASDLAISAMGNMGNMGGGGMGGEDTRNGKLRGEDTGNGDMDNGDRMDKPGVPGGMNGAQKPDDTQMPGGMQPSDGAQMPDGMQPPDGAQMPDGMQPPDEAQMPDGMQPPDEAQMPDDKKQ